MCTLSDARGLVWGLKKRHRQVLVHQKKRCLTKRTKAESTYPYDETLRLREQRYQPECLSLGPQTERAKYVQVPVGEDVVSCSARLIRLTCLASMREVTGSETSLASLERIVSLPLIAG